MPPKKGGRGGGGGGGGGNQQQQQQQQQQGGGGRGNQQQGGGKKANQQQQQPQQTPPSPQAPQPKIPPSTGGTSLGGASRENPKAKSAKKQQQQQQTKPEDSPVLEIVTPGAQQAQEKTGGFQFNFDPSNTEFKFSNQGAPAFSNVSHKKGKRRVVEEDFDDEDDDEELEDEEEEGEDFVASLPASVQTRVKALKQLQEKYQENHRAFLKELRVLEEKYDKINAPLFTKRSEIVTGSYEPTPEDISEADRASFTAPASSDPKGIPDFWLQVLQNSNFEELIQEHDIDALKHLRDISAQTRENEFDLVFTFDENPYFTNQILKKTYKFEEEPDGTEAVTETDATKIEWNPGKNLTVTTITQKRKQKGKVKNVVRTEPRDSFFNFFTPKSNKHLEDEDDEEQENALDEFEYDFDLGRELKDNIIPRAVLWFTGELAPEMPDFSGFNFGGDDDDEEDDDDDDDEEFQLPRSKKGGHSHGGGGHHHHHHHHGAAGGGGHSHPHGGHTHPHQHNPPKGGNAKGAPPTSNVEQPAECKQQ